MKTKILFFLSIIFLKGVIAFAQYGGTTGDLIWTFNLSDGTLIISGEGEMPNYSDFPTHFAPWYVSRDFISTVIIEQGVTSIGNRAFYSCEHITAITMPNSVTRIGNDAFRFCFRLPFMNIPNNVTTIGNMAFEGCSSLFLITIPKSVTSIGYLAFNDCKELIFINVESENNYYESINGVLFDKSRTTLIRCPQRKPNVYVIPDNVKIIYDYAFSRCTDLTTIVIANTVTDIGEYAFSYCENLNSMVIPNSVINLGERAFSNCSMMTSVTLSNSIEIVKNGSFIYCDTLSSIFISSSVKSIEPLAFFCLGSLTSITNLRLYPIYLNMEVFINTSGFPCIDLKNITLFVPTNSVWAYEKAFGWNRFNVVGGGILVNSVANNSKYGYTKGNGLYEMDTTATVAAFAHSGNTFINWTINGVEVSTENPYTFTVIEDVELVANFEHVVGVENIPIEKSVNVFPNPTTGELQVTSYKLQVTSIGVFDIYGRRQKAKSRRQKGEGSFEVDISELVAGIYFIKIKTEAGIITKKVIKN